MTHKRIGDISYNTGSDYPESNLEQNSCPGVLCKDSDCCVEKTSCDQVAATVCKVEDHRVPKLNASSIVCDNDKCFGEGFDKCCDAIPQCSDIESIECPEMHSPDLQRSINIVILTLQQILAQIMH